MSNQNRTRFNRITYITSENPKAVARLLDKAGFQVPDNLPDLVEAAKEWVRLEGQKAVIQLLQVHPERQAILAANAHLEESNFSGCGCQSNFSSGESCGCGCGGNSNFAGCGCQSSFSADPGTQQLLDELGQLTRTELTNRLNKLKRLVRQEPENAALREEMELTWDQLRPDEQEKELSTQSQEKAKPAEDKQKASLFQITKKDVVIGGFILGLALLLTRLNKQST